MLLATSLLTPSVGYLDYRPQFDELKTRLGVVRVVRRDPDVPGLDNLMVNGKVILESDLYLGLYGQFQTHDGVAVLFGENQGGHNWVWDLSFLVLKAHRKPVIVTTENFS